MKTASFLLAVLIVVNMAAPQTSPAPQSQPGRRSPQAKTQQEYKDYNADYALSGGAVVEKAADEFAARYPQSELREYLYSKAMHE